MRGGLEKLRFQEQRIYKDMAALTSMRNDEEEKRKAEIEQWEKTRDDAKERGWTVILEHAEKRLDEVKPSKRPELEAA